MDMDQLAEADLPAVLRELNVPSGVQTTIAEGIRRFADGTFAEHHAMPQGDLNSNAPQQTKSWTSTQIAVVAFLVGAAVMTAGGLGVVEAAAAAAARAAAAVAAAGASAVAVLLAPLADCLDGDTCITMADRTKKRIKDIKEGDKILSFNKGRKRVRSVVKVTTGSSDTMRQMSLCDSKGKKFTIKATAGHPFYTKENGWAVLAPEEANLDKSSPVCKLTIGEMLVLQGQVAEVISVSSALPKQPTFNLVLDGAGTFFAQDILSHSGLPHEK